MSANVGSFHARVRSALRQMEPLARERLQGRMAEAFAEFAAHWADFFAPAAASQRREVRGAALAVRRRQFERFGRDHSAWARILEGLEPAVALAPSGSFAPSRNPLARRLRRHADWDSAIHGMHRDVDALLSAQERERPYPVRLHSRLRELGLDAEATPGEVKRRYRELVRSHHPDGSGDGERMTRLNLAFGELQAHDRLRRDSVGLVG